MKWLVFLVVGVALIISCPSLATVLVFLFGLAYACLYVASLIFKTMKNALKKRKVARDAPLMEAVGAGSVETARRLRAAGTNPNAADKDGLTALMSAVLTGKRMFFNGLIGLYTALLTNTFCVPAMIGATFPDIDVIWSYRKTEDGYKPNCKLPSYIRHRGITHHFAPYVIIYILSFFIHPVYEIIIQSFLLGVLTHLVADALNPAGIPIWSFKRKWSLKKFKIRSMTEFILLTCLVIGLLFFPMTAYINQMLFLELFFNLR